MAKTQNRLGCCPECENDNHRCTCGRPSAQLISVKCDESNNSEADRLENRLNVDVLIGIPFPCGVKYD